MAAKKQDQNTFFEKVKIAYLDFAKALYNDNIPVYITPAEYDYIRSLTAFQEEDAMAMHISFLFGLDLGSEESEIFLRHLSPLLDLFRSEEMNQIDEYKLKTSLQSVYKNAKISKTDPYQISEIAKKQKTGT